MKDTTWKHAHQKHDMQTSQWSSTPSLASRGQPSLQRYRSEDAMTGACLAPADRLDRNMCSLGNIRRPVLGDRITRL